VVILRSTSSTGSLKLWNQYLPCLKCCMHPRLTMGLNWFWSVWNLPCANGIEHGTRAPLWPQASWEVERQNCTLIKSVQIVHIEGKDWRQELQTFLTAYRSTPQMPTGATPFYLMFGRSKLPDLWREAPITNEEVRDRDWSRKLSQKEYIDAKSITVASKVWIGDKVLLSNSKNNKLSPNYDPNPCEVVHRKWGEVTIRSTGGAEIKRDVLFVKSIERNPWRRKLKLGLSIKSNTEGTNQAELAKGGNELPKARANWIFDVCSTSPYLKSTEVDGSSEANSKCQTASKIWRLRTF